MDKPLKTYWKKNAQSLKHNDTKLPLRMWYGIMGDMATNYSLSYMKFSIVPLRDNLEFGTLVGRVGSVGNVSIEGGDSN